MSFSSRKFNSLWLLLWFCPEWTCVVISVAQKVLNDMIYFLIGLHCRLRLHWLTSEWSCLIACHCIYDSWALCCCHFCRFAQLSLLLTWQLVLLQHRDRPSSKSCRQASGRPTGVVAPEIVYKTIFVYWLDSNRNVFMAFHRFPQWRLWKSHKTLLLSSI